MIVRAPFFNQSGYAQHLRELLAGFTDAGLAPEYEPTNGDKKNCPEWLAGYIAPFTSWNEEHRVPGAPREGVFQLSPPAVPLEKDSVLLTMWETSEIPNTCQQNLSLARKIIVPCHWNAKAFAA